MDPPSAQLIDRLRELRLCRPGDLRRCRSLVRRLARDLPTFDSVWIDALVQTRRLTPFQARILDSSDANRLGVGPFVLIDDLGDDGRLHRFLARERDGRTRYLLTQARCLNEHPSKALDRVRESIRATAGLREHSLNPPLGCALQDDLVTIVSPHVPGPTFAELLVRRGRFPAVVVLDIASQLSRGLASLEAAQVVHGDVRLRNVILSRSGHAVLLHPGLLSAVDPEMTIHAEYPPDAYDTVAPERIGTGAPASTASDMYALGCLLFELTAGRPPFLHADPLTKLAAHQIRSIPDVRSCAPETPESIARLIMHLTAREPAQRPSSFSDLSRKLKRHGTSGRLKRFAATFQHPVPIRRPPARWSPARRLVVPLLLVLGAASLALLHAGARTELLSIASTLTQSIRDAVQEAAGDPAARNARSDDYGSRDTALRPFPMNVEDGVLTLDGPGPYSAGRLASVGPLVVRGTAGDRPVIVIRDEPLELWAEQIVLENLVLVSSGRQASRTSMLSVNCQNFGLRNCSLDTATDPDGVAVTWTALDEGSAAAPRIGLVDCLFAGQGSALRLKSRPASVLMQNLLQLSGQSLLEISHTSAAARPIQVTLRAATLRESQCLLSLTGVSHSNPAPSVVLTLENAALAFTPQQSALVLYSDDPPADWHAHIRVTGLDSLIRPETTLAAVLNESGTGITPLDASQMSIDGLFAAQFTFAGDDILDPADAVISASQQPVHSLTPPGANIEAFSPSEVHAYNDQ